MNNFHQQHHTRGIVVDDMSRSCQEINLINSCERSRIEELAEHSRTRSIALVAMFGCIWGVVEIQLGTMLQILGMPFRGSFLAALAVIILSSGRMIINRRGSVILIGVVAGFLKFIFVGSLAFYPTIAIVIESMVVEICLWPRVVRTKHFLCAGSVAVVAMLLYPFFSQGLLGGWKITEVYFKFILKAGNSFGWNQNAFIVIGVLVVFHLSLGIVAGVIAKLTISVLKKRLIIYPRLSPNRGPIVQPALEVNATDDERSR